MPSRTNLVRQTPGEVRLSCYQGTSGNSDSQSFLKSFSMRLSRVLLGIWIGLLGFNRLLSAHEPHENHSHVGQEILDAKGVVFEDHNENGIQDENESGIEGIHVSNGRKIVTTDSDGKYALKVSEDSIVFVLKPRGWKCPLNELNLPQFYYIHKPKGSPKNFKYPGVEPTGPLPDSINFPLTKQREPKQFRAILFGDTQPRNIKEVEYIEHDVIEQVIAAEAHDAAFGVTLGDIVFDDLDMMTPLNRAIALIDIPWYNVIGNHDMNLDASNDVLSDETFESHYGPSYYSFDYGPTHFIVLDDVTWVGGEQGKRGRYFGGLGERQLEFVRNDLNLIPKEQLVVLLMHIPLTEVKDRQELYRMIEHRPATVSVSAHTHYLEHRFIGKEDGWMGPERHHHIVNVTVCGSWWRGKPDERGIPHATMSDGGPNGYSMLCFDGNKYSFELRPASRLANYQMNIYAPEVVSQADLITTVVTANVFAASEEWKCSLRVGESPWKKMDRFRGTDPAYVKETELESSLEKRDWIDLPRPHRTPHLYRGMLPVDLPIGSHKIEIRIRKPNGDEFVNRRIIRVE